MSVNDPDAKRLVWWLLLVFASIAGTLALGYGNALSQSDQRIEDRTTKIEYRVNELEKQFTRIDSKLDMLLEQTRESRKR